MTSSVGSSEVKWAKGGLTSADSNTSAPDHALTLRMTLEVFPKRDIKIRCSSCMNLMQLSYLFYSNLIAMFLTIIARIKYSTLMKEEALQIVFMRKSANNYIKCKVFDSTVMYGRRVRWGGMANERQNPDAVWHGRFLENNSHLARQG